MIVRSNGEALTNSDGALLAFASVKEAGPWLMAGERAEPLPEGYDGEVVAPVSSPASRKPD